jgi:hypothetical protein
MIKAESAGPRCSLGTGAGDVLGLEPVSVASEVERTDVGLCLSDQVAFGEEDLLSAVGLDVLTTFAAKRSQKLLPRCERCIYRRSSREREMRAITESSPELITEIPDLWA